MKTMLTSLALCGLLTPLTARAEDKKDEKPAIVKEIDLKGLKLPPARGGNATKPTTITSAEELAKAIPDEEAQAKIKKDVDFAKQKVVFFAWAGSGQDKLTTITADGKSEVVFSYERGLTKDLRSHLRLFVLPKDATVTIVPKP